MKLKIKNEYFEQIKAGIKKLDFRDAHITFECETTGKTIRKEVTSTQIAPRSALPKELIDSKMFTDNSIIVFMLGDN